MIIKYEVKQDHAVRHIMCCSEKMVYQMKLQLFVVIKHQKFHCEKVQLDSKVYKHIWSIAPQKKDKKVKLNLFINPTPTYGLRHALVGHTRWW